MLLNKQECHSLVTGGVALSVSQLLVVSSGQVKEGVTLGGALGDVDVGVTVDDGVHLSGDDPVCGGKTTNDQI